MEYMLVCDRGDIIPIGEYIPLTEEDATIPEHAILRQYWRMDSIIIKPVMLKDGSFIPAHETEEFAAFNAVGDYHEYSAIKGVPGDYEYDEDDDSQIPIVENISGVRYILDQAYFVEFEWVEGLMKFLSRNCEAPYIIGDQYENGIWSADSYIPFIVVDPIKMSLEEYEDDDDNGDTKPL